jgi:predicted dehydrogenase
MRLAMAPLPIPGDSPVSDLSRRHFLGASSAGLLAVSAARAADSNERLSVGIVGPGGRGRGILGATLKLCKAHKAEVTAVCDIWGRNRDLAADVVKKESGKQPRAFSRLEDMLAAKDLDAVLIATPDHQHARQLIECLKAKKHVYCEKPFANRLDDANDAIAAARKSDRVVTIGTQRRSDPRYVAASELVASGAIGQVVQVELVQNAYSPYRWRSPALVKLVKEKDTDWKAFLMGREMRKFDPHQYVEFRLYRDFSTGIIDQWMTHMIDTVHLLAGAKFPKSVTAHGGCFAWKDGRENGDCVQVALDYGGFLATYGCTLANGAGAGCRVLGQKGSLEFEKGWTVSGEGVTGSKVEKKTIEPKGGEKGEMGVLHLANWLSCCHKGERKTACTPEHGYQHAIACIMADRALHGGRRETFDEKSSAIKEG